MSGTKGFRGRTGERGLPGKKLRDIYLKIWIEFSSGPIEFCFKKVIQLNLQIRVMLPINRNLKSYKPYHVLLVPNF